jgi:hypothetical protein
MPALALTFQFPGLGNTTATSTSITYPSPNTTSTFTLVSEQEQGNGYFGASNGISTAQYTVLGTFVGTCTMQGTLSTDPIDVSSTQTDWFDIANTAIQFNQPGYTTTNYVNFSGNFVYVRAKVDIALGGVQFVNYNY